ncbi:MAG: hypothetical protein UW74_C0043G0005 [Candidatus Giovannonibacteria bacterium GW2011_GWC2_44_8]|uniref:UPF0102 protein UW74_C0043G0005 n=1 Tax=Candidatus Giovannonibacteria bacterium GW2011_GWC2_44_8 TaxID=1618657 RepID=A0A0G1K0E6_9BACT|nr:MAG: hypothetical protein UW74_C0043G0005 [Candidatus Giovannonibacteria bacterium GW2011_GWC2_44_8]KKU70388.1 MAG: hypothetical protein UX94_C0007G0017 [Parcubacteria group bacterium GW2011_GWA2_47_21]
MPSQKRKFGDIGEKEAESFLIKTGYRIIDRNYRIKNLGEIDLVGERKKKLFFFEVKTRDLKHELNFPIGFSIDNKKRRNLKRICQLYLADKKLSNKEWQVDAIFVKVDFDNKNHMIEHLENILWERYY